MFASETDNELPLISGFSYQLQSSLNRHLPVCRPKLNLKPRQMKQFNAGLRFTLSNMIHAVNLHFFPHHGLNTLQLQRIPAAK